MTPISLITETEVSKNLQFHLDEGLSVTDNVFRPYSENFFELINETRKLYDKNLIQVGLEDKWLMESTFLP